MSEIMIEGRQPTGWAVRMLGQVFRERKEKGSDVEFPALSVTKQGILPQLETAAKTDRGDDRKIVRAGDYVINSRSDRKGSGGISTLEGSVSLISIVMKPTGIVQSFAHHLLRSVAFQEEFYRFGRGIVADLWSTRFDDLKRIKIFLPPENEQVLIASSLDRETAHIDSLIEKKTRFIELLKEKRQALITQVVTKGLDPNVSMRDSGVEWIGDVPEHWLVVPLKRLVSRPITDGPHETPVKQAEGIPFVSAEAVGQGRINFHKIWGYISLADHARYSKKYSPQAGDIYMVKSGATTGITAIVEDDREFSIWSPLAAIRPNELVEPKFLLAALRSTPFIDGIAINWSYGTQQNIGMKTLSNLPVVVPSIEYQRGVLSKLDADENRYERLLDASQRSVALLQERRSALITAAVTGQIDLREAS
jgi:type I restriction enzyme S subunit